MLGTFTLRSCDMLGDGTAGFAGFSAANVDIDGCADAFGAFDGTCVAKGSIQTRTRIAVHVTAAGIQKLERVRDFATLA